LEGTPSAAASQEDERTLLAAVRTLEVIGEAAKSIPKAFRDKHPHVPWRGMTGTRDKVIHEYFAVDVEVVWRTVREALPPLRKAIAYIIEALRREGESLL